MIERYGLNKVGKYGLHNPDFEGYLSIRGFRRMALCQWVTDLFCLKGEGLCNIFWYDHARRLKNDYFDEYVFSPYIDMNVLSEYVKNDNDVIIKEFSKHGYLCFIMPNIYVERRDIISGNGKILGSLAFIRQYNQRPL